MSLTLTPQEAEEARVLLNRLQVLLGERAPSVAPVPAPPVEPPRPRILTDADRAEAAALLGCDVATIRAVCDVEARGEGFGADGRPIILYEPHVFSRLTDHRFDRTHGGVSYAKRGAKPYPASQTARWDQVLYAAKLDHAAAYQAASYGLFQIMGFNHAACGFPDVDSFVTAMRTDERAHLLAFVAFVKSERLDDELRERRWADFARRYNGPAYAENKYDAKLASAYAKRSAA